MRNKENIVPLSKELIEKLRSLQATTGWGSRTLYNYAVKQKLDPIFDKISFGIIESWRNGSAKTVDITIFETVIQAYQNIPQELWKTSKWEGGRIIISDDFREKLRYIIDYSPKLYLRLKYSDIPHTLTPASIKSAATGKKKSFKKEEVNFLESLYENIKSQNDR